MAFDMFMKFTPAWRARPETRSTRGRSTSSPGAGECRTADRPTWAAVRAGKASVQDLSFTKYIEKSSCDLLSASCARAALRYGLVTVRKAGWHAAGVPHRSR